MVDFPVSVTKFSHLRWT